MGEKLASSPLIEAICEFKFAPSESWDWTIPGRLYDKISSEFSEKSQVEGMQIELKMQPGGEPAPQVIRGPALVQMKRKDGSAMVQVGPEILAINQLHPYSEWKAFSSQILKVFDRYTEIVGTWALSRIGLRYINRIAMKEAHTDLNTLACLVPKLSGALDKTIAGFYQRFELLHETPKGVLILQTGVQRGDGSPAMMIDLDFGSRGNETQPDRASLPKWLDEAHDRVYESFVASLNPDLYRRLKEGRA